MNDQSSTLNTSRRSVLRTAAWSVPVVTLATAAPAFADSSATGTIAVTTFTGSTERLGDDGIRVNGLRIVNNTDRVLPAINFQVAITMDPSWGVSGAYWGGTGIREMPASYAPGQNPVLFTLPTTEPLAIGGSAQLLFGGNDLRWYMPSLPSAVGVLSDTISVSVQPSSGYPSVTGVARPATMLAGGVWL